MIYPKKFGSTGQTIVFLPGGAIDIRCYAKLIDKIAETNTVYAVDFLRLKSKSITETKELISIFIRSLNQSNIVLIGHSFGGALASELSAELPEVTLAILFNPTIFKHSQNIFGLVKLILYKTIFGGLRFPHLLGFYISNNFYLHSDLLVAPVNTLAHFKQALWNNLHPIQYSPGNMKNWIIYTKQDELMPLQELPADFDLRKAFKGNHDWIMNDIDKTNMIISRLINSSN